jgi:hypothetical protein
MSYKIEVHNRLIPDPELFSIPEKTLLIIHFLSTRRIPISQEASSSHSTNTKLIRSL